MNRTDGLTATTPTETTTPSGSKPESSNEPTPLQSEGERTDLTPGRLLVNRVTKRENAREKAARLLVSGRLRVVKVDGDLIIAECRGDSGEVYKLGYRPDQKRWGCTCQARTACSHQHALWAVVALERS